MRSTRVVVLGGGIAGLSAARELQNAGVDVRLFEAGPQVAGLASTHRDPDGFSFDLGAHFITNRLAAAVGISAECRVVRRYGEMVRLNGRLYRYPTGLLANPRLLMSAITSRLSGDHGDPDSAREWFRHEYGRQLADRVAVPLLEAWSGVDGDELSAAVGDKLPGTIAHTLYLRVAAKVTRRAVAIGYCSTQPESASVFHVYRVTESLRCARHLLEILGTASISIPPSRQSSRTTRRYGRYASVVLKLRPTRS